MPLYLQKKNQELVLNKISKNIVINLDRLVNYVQ